VGGKELTKEYIHKKKTTAKRTSQNSRDRSTQKRKKMNHGEKRKVAVLTNPQKKKFGEKRPGNTTTPTHRKNKETC